jgi:hypothetical protein
VKRNNKLVWDETKLIVQDLFDNVWGSQREISVDHAVDFTLPVSVPVYSTRYHASHTPKLALFVIGVAGFGRRVKWAEDETVPAGHTMTFKASRQHIAPSVVEPSHPHRLPSTMCREACSRGWSYQSGCSNSAQRSIYERSGPALTNSRCDVLLSLGDRERHLTLESRTICSR